jgi:hypothetical protein
MLGRCFALLTLALIGAVGLSAPALPQDATAPCRLCKPDGAPVDTKPAKPITLDVQASLDFDRLILSGLGNGGAELAPDGTRIATGSVASIGARAMAGEVVIRGEPDRYVRVVLPETIELHGLSGGTIRLESIRSDLPAMPRLDGSGSLRFRFGGVVKLLGDVDGEFRGDVPVDVEYF